MRRNINNAVSDIMDNFLLMSNTGHIEKKIENGFSVVSQDLFAHIDDRKRVIAHIKANGLDPFKRGTKEPKAIENLLDHSSWDEIKELDPNAARVTSFMD